MHRAAAAAPAVAHGGERAPAAGNDQMQVARILDHRYEMLIVCRIDIEGARTFRPPVATAFAKGGHTGVGGSSPWLQQRIFDTGDATEDTFTRSGWQIVLPFLRSESTQST